MIIDSTYFGIGLLHIEGITISEENVGYSVNVEANKNLLLNDVIERKQSEYLAFVLGNNIYQKFVNGLKSDPIEQKWIDLKKLFADTEKKISPIANYVYVHFIRQEETKIALSATAVKPKSDNMMIVSNYIKIHDAWNDMVRLNSLLFEELQKKVETYCIDDTYNYCNWDYLLSNECHGI